MQDRASHSTHTTKHVGWVHEGNWHIEGVFFVDVDDDEEVVEEWSASFVTLATEEEDITVGKAARKLDEFEAPEWAEEVEEAEEGRTTPPAVVVDPLNCEEEEEAPKSVWEMVEFVGEDPFP